MSEADRERLIGWWRAFDDPFVLWATVGVAVVLALSLATVVALRALGKVDQALYRDVLTRWRSWLWLAAFMLGPILLGAAWVMAATCLLSLLCYREFARVTGLFREKAISIVVVLGILLVTLAVFDHWDGLLFACSALTVAMIAAVTLPQDRPKGYIQRVGLGTLGFVLFGYSLGFVGYMANAPDYRARLIWLLLCVEMNDVFAYCVGKSIGGPKLVPNTSPGKTIAGSAGAVVLTTALTAALGHVVFRGTDIDAWQHLLLLGLGVSVLGQLGDLMLSSIKRDVQVKDTGALLPGHGGLLDRFDSLFLVAPAVYYYLTLHLGPAGGAASRIITGR
jgi:phosphatidate cytidylyltransferase